MAPSAVFDYIGDLAGIAALALAIKGVYHASRLPPRPPNSPLLREHFAACLLLVVCIICGLLGDPGVQRAWWRTAGQVMAASMFIGLAVTSYVRSRRLAEAASG